MRLPTSELSNMLSTRPLDNQGGTDENLINKGLVDFFEEKNLAKYEDSDGKISIPIYENYNSLLTRSILPNLDLSSLIKPISNPISNPDPTQFISDFRSQQKLLFGLYQPDEEIIPVEVENVNMGDDKSNIFTNNSNSFQTYNGGNGLDIFSTHQVVSYYTISANSLFSQQITLSHSTPIEWISLHNIERIQFSNTNLAFDLYESAGIVAKVYGAVLGKNSLSDRELIGDGLDAVDAGLSYENFATITIQSIGIQTNSEIVRTLWTNVVGSDPTESQEQPYIDMLNSGEKSIGELVKYAAETELNQQNINLTGLADKGIEYL